jgi:hypothetical protein
MFARVLLMSEGKTNNRDRDIHPCFAMFSGVEMVLWKAAKDPSCMELPLDRHAIPYARSQKKEPRAIALCIAPGLVPGVVTIPATQ